MNKINRYNLLGVVAVLMVSFFPACNNDAPDVPEKLALEFDSSINNENWEEQSRVVKDSNISILDFSEGDTIRVDLWSLPSGSSSTTDDPDLMRKQLMTYTSSQWDYSPKQYWTNVVDDRLVVFAHYLAGATNCVVDENWDPSSGYPTIRFTKYNCNSDILVSPIKFLDKSDLENGKIKLNFRHIMTRLNMDVRYYGDEAGKGEYNSIFLEKVTFWNFPNVATFTGFDGEKPMWKDVSYTTKGWADETGYTIEWGDSYKRLHDFTQFHYPFVCKHYDANNPTHGRNAKIGFTVKKINALGDKDKLYADTAYVEKWFDAEIEGGKSYTFKVTITPKNQVILDLESNWWNDTENNGDANFLK